jgi:hypothetical protein
VWEKGIFGGKKALFSFPNWLNFSIFHRWVFMLRKHVFGCIDHQKTAQKAGF